MNPTEAEEHLRVIRRLMERATIYRAISAPTAMVGGVLSLGVGAALHFKLSEHTAMDEAVGQNLFLGVWGIVFLLTGAANVFFLGREARKRDGGFLSPGMRKAFGALFPAILTAGVLTFVLAFVHLFTLLPIVWMIFYGLALLSAAQFSPDAIPRLGWAFLISGLLSIGLTCAKVLDTLSAPHLMMALTFGGLHFIYAVLTWSTPEGDSHA